MKNKKQKKMNKIVVNKEFYDELFKEPEPEETK